MPDYTYDAPFSDRKYVTVDQPDHEHVWQYIGTQVDDERALWPIQHWYRCPVCKLKRGRKPSYA